MNGTGDVDCASLDLGDWGCLNLGQISLFSIIALFPLFFGMWMKILGGETWRVRVGVLVYEAKWSTSYARLLEIVQNVLSSLFGAPWSLKSLDMCFRLSLVYALAYTVTDGIAETAKYTILGIGSGILAFLVNRWHLRAKRNLANGKRRLWLNLREPLIYLALASVFFVEIGNSSTFPKITLALAFAVTGAALGGGALAATAVVIVVIAVFGLAMINAGEDVSYAVAIAFAAFTIFFIIPALNALLDWLSWAASRWLISRLRSDATQSSFFQRLWRLFFHLLIDAALAFACLFVLAILLINLIYALDDPGYWAILSAAKEAPFSEDGSSMTIMLLSTLVPTALHLFFALFAMAAIRPPYRDWFAGWLEESAGGKEWGNRCIVAAYLTFWMVFALAVIWVATVELLPRLDTLWVSLGWGLATETHPFWASIFRTAEHLVFF